MDKVLSKDAAESLYNFIIQCTVTNAVKFNMEKCTLMATLKMVPRYQACYKMWPTKLTRPSTTVSSTCTHPILAYLLTLTTRLLDQSFTVARFTYHTCIARSKVNGRIKIRVHAWTWFIVCPCGQLSIQLVSLDASRQYWHSREPYLSHDRDLKVQSILLQ